MVSNAMLILSIGILIAVGGALAKLAWKAIVVIGLLVTGFGALNFIFGWIK